MNNTDLLNNLVAVAELAGVKMSPKDICMECFPAPHSPPKNLPDGKMAIYIFSFGEQFLKVGKVGPKSNARYTSQHYSPKSSNSNLAKSILSVASEFDPKINEINVGEWIKQNTNRINLLIESSYGVSLLSLFETFLHCKLSPKFEGFDSQKPHNQSPENDA